MAPRDALKNMFDLHNANILASFYILGILAWNW